MEPSDIKAFRKARGQSQSAFGADLAVGRKTIQRWEHGETSPPGRLLELACRQLEQGVKWVTPDELAEMYPEPQDESEQQ